VIRRLLEIILSAIIGLSGIGFVALGIWMMSSDFKQSKAPPYWVIIFMIALGFLCLRIAYTFLRKAKQTSSISKCCKCGATTEIQEIFVSDRRLFSSTFRMYCPICWNERKTSNYKWNIAVSLLIGAAGLILLQIYPGSAIAYFFLNVFLLEALQILSIFLHELSHAWTARIVGMNVYRICIGIGKRYFKRKLFNFEIDYRGLPIISAVIAAYPAKENSNTRQLLLVAAGPLLNVSLVILALFFIPVNELWNIRIFFHRVAPWHVLFWSNVLVLIINLLPRKIPTPFGIVETDGMQLAKNFKKSDEELDRRHASYFLLEGAIQVEKKDYEKAGFWLGKGLDHYKENFVLLNSLGIVLLKQKNFLGARECFQKALKAASTPVNEALTMNNIAYVDALIEDHELLEEADRYSEKAMLVLSWMPAIKGTRGTVLLQLGKIDEAIVLLNDALRMHDEPDGKAENCYFVAIAEHKRGNFEQSQRYLNEARKLDPDCYLLERVEKLISVTTAQI
jgi:tetratricopeptide (TPR) repeat protein